EQSRFGRGWFLNSRPAKKTCAQFGVPANVVPPAHLILEEARQQQTLRSRGFHHETVVQQRRVGHKMIEDPAEIRRSWQVDVRLCGYLSVVRQHASVIKQFLSIDLWLGYVL